MENIQPQQILKRSTCFKLSLEEKVKKKIRQTCNEIWNEEWSGILFYTTEGSFKNGDLLIKVLDLYVMDIGSQSYTEFDMSAEVIHYMSEKDLIGCYTGLIHSHNNMPTFFSNTDINTLRDEALVSNHFVSLIVNNKGEYSAAITRKGTIEKNIKSNISFNTFNDEPVKSIEEGVIKENFLEWFPLKVVTPKEDIELIKEVHNRLESLKAKVKTLYSNPYLQGTQEQYTFNFDKEPVFKNTEDINDKKVTIPNSSPTNAKVKCDPKLVKSLLLQLLTGSIIISDNSKLDIKKWASSMTNFFDKRFGKSNEDFQYFTIWADEHVGFICTYIMEENVDNINFDPDEISSAYAEALIEELENLPQNKYIRYYINALKGFIL